MEGFEYVHISYGEIRNKMTLLGKLKKHRTSLQLSQEYVANRLGISQKAYSDIESG